MPKQTTPPMRQSTNPRMRCLRDSQKSSSSEENQCVEEEEEDEEESFGEDERENFCENHDRMPGEEESPLTRFSRLEDGGTLDDLFK